MAVRYRAAEHLKQNRFGIFYFRRVIPPELRGFFAIKQVSRSMGTSDRKHAAARARRNSAALDLLFERSQAFAKGKKNGELQVDWTVKLDFEEDGSLKSLLADVAPGKEQAAAPRLRFSGWLRLFPELRRGVRRPHELGHDLIYLRPLFEDTASPLRRRSLR